MPGLLTLSSFVYMYAMCIVFVTTYQYQYHEWKGSTGDGNVVNMNQGNLEEIGKQQSQEKEPQQYKSFAFASYYSDHMVLQKAPKRAAIWGYAANIGERIIIRMSERGIYQTHVYKDPLYGYGVWKITLPAESSAGPFTIEAISSEKTITLNDVLFGDVWLCSGQSNMRFSMSQVYNATEELKETVNYPKIRIMAVRDNTSSTPIPDLKEILEPWSVPSNVTVGGPPFMYFSATCWLYGKYLYNTLKYPIGLIDTAWGGTKVEAWSSTDALAKCGLSEQADRHEDEHVSKEDAEDGVSVNYSALWNAMVHPFLNMTIFGAIWYQGEANVVVNVHKYNCTFPALIEDWRKKFHEGSQGETDPLFPFGFVQLAANSPNSNKPGFPEIRWHQTADYGFVPNPQMPNVFMATALDLPDFASPYGSIHPRDKQDVAARLVLSGLSVAYNHTGLTYQGPLPTSVYQEAADKITLKYSQNIHYANYVGFEVLCSIQSSSMTFWAPAPIISTMQTNLTLFSNVCGQGMSTLAVRYNWKESPCAFKSCAVYSDSKPSLPGPPFIVYRESSKLQTLTWAQPHRLQRHNLFNNIIGPQ